MNIGSWCIKNNRTTIVALLLVAFAGVSTFFSMARLEDPEFIIRVAVVTAYFPGASPKKVEELVTDKIEKKIQEMTEVKTITSQSMTGFSVVMVEVYAKYDDMQPIWQRLRNKMADVQRNLPEGVYGPYVNDEFGDVFPIVLALTGDGYSYRELKDIADEVRDALLRLDTVAKVDYYGTQAERIFVEFSNARLAEMGYAPNQLADMLRAQNVLQPGGEMVVGPDRIAIEASGEFKDLDQVRDVSMRVAGRPEAILLGDICTIRRGFVDPPTTLTRYNNQPCIMLALSMPPDKKATDMGLQVKALVAQLQDRQPVGIDLNVFLYQPKYVDRAIDEFMGNLKDSFFYVVVILLVFAGIRMGLIAGSLVPMTMLMTIALMPLFNIKLQSVSIASLIIALGMLVDNGIVTSENILVRLAAGEDRLSACAAAVKELWLPLLTSSLTTIVAFLPIATAQSDVGEYCVSLFQVITITLLCSWVLSLTMMPLLSYYFMKPKASNQQYDGFFYRLYRSLLVSSLRHRFAFTVVTIVLLVLSLYCFRFIPSIFFPPNQREMFMVDFWQPYGTDIRTTRDRVAQLEALLMSDTNVASVGTFVGEGGPRWMLALNIEQENPNYANVIVNTHNRASVPGLMARARQFLDDQMPECNYTVKELESGPPVGAPVKIRIAGKNVDTIYQLRDKLAAVLVSVPGAINVRDNWGEWVKKLEVEVNQEQARLQGFTSYDVASSLQSQVSGLQATEYREGKEVIPIMIRSEGAYRNDLGKVESMNVYSYNTGKRIPLLQIAHAKLTWEPSNIIRRDKIRNMEIRADVLGRYASEVIADLEPKVAALVNSPEWADGYTVEISGENAESSDAQNSIMAGLPLAVGIILLILIGQFNSIRRPLIIILTVPPMLVGVVFGLWISDAPFGFMAFLGLISLMGVVVNNAIIMIDRIELERGCGQTTQDAIVVSAQRRLRPILMTATTTVIGLVPLSLNGGEMWRPMANTIMFGLGFATLLTLGLCPVLYSYFFKAPFGDYAWKPEVLKKSQE